MIAKVVEKTTLKKGSVQPVGRRRSSHPELSRNIVAQTAV